MKAGIASRLLVLYHGAANRLELGTSNTQCMETLHFDPWVAGLSWSSEGSSLVAEGPCCFARSTLSAWCLPTSSPKGEADQPCNNSLQRALLAGVQKQCFDELLVIVSCFTMSRASFAVSVGPFPTQVVLASLRCAVAPGRLPRSTACQILGFLHAGVCESGSAARTW